MENLKQYLLEAMADYLDDVNVTMEMFLLELKDNDDLHIKMCEAAFKVFEEETK